MFETNTFTYKGWVIYTWYVSEFCVPIFDVVASVLVFVQDTLYMVECNKQLLNLGKMLSEVPPTSTHAHGKFYGDILYSTFACNFINNHAYVIIIIVLCVLYIISY